MDRCAEPKVSVVLPTYNHLQFLPKAIEGVLGQTYGDFELVVVNDGSTDGTKEYLDGLDDPRIRVVHQENRRLPEALNAGFRAARGEMLTWISADNYCTPDFLKHLVGALEAYPEAGFAYSAFANMDGDGNVISIREDQSLLFHDILVGNPGVASFLYRRSCQEKIGYYDPSVECAEDWDYWIRILEHFEPVYVPQVLYYYRRHDDTMSTRMAEEVYRASRKVFDKAMKRRNHQVDLDELYPAIRLCRDKELARFHAGLDFGSRILRSRFADPAVAVEIFEQMRRRETGKLHVTSNLAVAYARQGRWDRVLLLVQELTKQTKDPDVMRACRAIINAQGMDDLQSLTNVALFVLDRTQSELSQREEQDLRVYRPQEHVDEPGSEETASRGEAIQAGRQEHSSEDDSSERTKASSDVSVSRREEGHILTAPKRLKIAVVANGNLYGFMKEIIAHWQTLHDVRMLDCQDQKAIAENLMTADVMWFEWAAAGVVQATHMPRRCKTIVRLHSYEAFRDFPGEINWNNVDDLVLVCPHIRSILADRFPDIEKLTRVNVIPNCVDLDKFYFKDKPFGKRIAFVGALRPAKNIPLLLQCFREIHAVDPEYSLHVAGELFGAPLHQGELFYYIKHALEQFRIKQSATFEGRVEDVSAWLDDKDFILSTSIREGHPVNVVEGMAKGLKPVVHNFPGAKSLYPSDWVFNTAVECRDLVLGTHLNRREYRAYAQKRWSSEVILPQLDALLNGAVTGTRHVACHPVAAEAAPIPTAQAEQRLAAPNDGLTIFAVPKAFSGHTGTIQKNAIRSWARLDPAPEIILFGDEPGIEELAQEVGARHEPHVGRNRLGTPLVNELFEAAQRLASNRVVAYVDADLILFNDFIEAVQTVRKQFSTFLLVGRHRDFTLLDALDFLPGWQEELRREAIQEGVLHAEDSVSYLVFSSDLYQEIPPFAIGRTAWGNWLVRTARTSEVPVIDGTEGVVAVHQDHAYDHVAGGFNGARHGEEAECNCTLAGQMDDDAYATGAAWVLDGECRLVRAEPREPELDSTVFLLRRTQWLTTQARRLMTADALDLAVCRWEESLTLLDELLGPRQTENVRAKLSNSAEISGGYRAACVSLAQCYTKLNRPEQAAATYTRLLEAPFVHVPEEQREQVLRLRDRLSERKEQGLREHPAPSQNNRRQHGAANKEFTIFSFTNGRSTYEYSARSLADSWDRQAEIVVLRDMHFPDAVRECLERCDTPYFFKVDDDFILHPKAVAYMRKRVSEYPNPDELGIYYCHLWEDWTSRVRQSVKVYRAEALRHIGGFKADYLGMVDKATKAALERAGFKVVKDQSVVALHACGSWEEQLEYERLWSSMADRPYRKSTHNAMKEYCGTKSLDQQYAMRLEWLEDVNRQLNTPFHTFLLEYASAGSSRAGALMPKVAWTGEGRTESGATTHHEPGARRTSAAVSVDQPKVSIILACRNAEAHLPECLNSILAQSMPDWELLLLDDGSTDETRRIIEDYAGRCSRIRPFFFDDHAGPYVRRNFAIRRARAPFVTIQDADDIMCPDKLQRLHAAIAGDERLGIVGSFYRKFLDELTDIAHTEPMILATTHEEIMQQYSAESIWDYCWHGSAIVRRRLFDEIGLYDENPFGADSFWLGKAAAYAHHTGRIRLSNLSQFLTLRRLHGRSQTGVLPVIDPRSRRVRYRQYCAARLRQAVQKAQGGATDLAHALRECTCDDFLRRFEAVIVESEKAPLDGRIVSHLLREIVEGLRNRRYVTCVHTLNGLETMDPAIAAQVPHFDLLRAMGFYGLGQREQCEVFLRREMANHENAIAEQFRRATFNDKVQIDVQQWCAAHADVLTFDRIDAVPTVSAPAESPIAEPDWQSQSLGLMEERYRSMTTTDPAKHAMAVRLCELARRLRLSDKCTVFEHEAQTIKNKLQALEPCRSTR